MCPHNLQHCLSSKKWLILYLKYKTISKFLASGTYNMREEHLPEVSLSLMFLHFDLPLFFLNRPRQNFTSYKSFSFISNIFFSLFMLFHSPPEILCCYTFVCPLLNLITNFVQTLTHLMISVAGAQILG